MGEADKQPLISVIVPVYNVEPYLRDCVDSIIAQTYTNLEIILVDDGCSDNGPVICDEYAQKDARVKVIHKKNGGVSSARNAALQICTGEYISFVDSDDYISTDYFTELIQYDADVVVSESKEATGFYNVSDVKQNYYRWGGFIGPCQKLYKNSCIKDIRFREDISVGEDIIFNLSVLSKIQSAYYIHYKGYHIVDNPASLTRGKLNKYDYRLDTEYQNKWGQILSEALKQAGILQQMTVDTDNANCSIWIYQKIKNYCYSDCPYCYTERLSRIRNQLNENRDVILSVETPASPRTYFIVKFCMFLNNAHLTYVILKLLIQLEKRGLI